MCLLNAYCGLSPAALYGEQEKKVKMSHANLV